MPIDTDKERTLFNKRAGARIVRKAIQAEIKRLQSHCITGRSMEDNVGWDTLQKLWEFIDGMIARDKKKKGGLWN